MTPKEKAIDIVDKMYAKSNPDDGIGYLEAIKCALVCVDEILGMLKNMRTNEHPIEDIKFRTKVEPYYRYMEAVKQEIEKL